jgi:hypothetical protein
MRERPILFSGEMVRAILALEKMQTRRVINIPKYARIKPCSHYLTPNDTHNGGVMLCYDTSGVADFEVLPCPYGQVGDRLWVRETFAIDDYSGDGIYSGRGNVVYYRATDHESCGQPWRPSIFMPRFASRITLEITGIRVEYLQEISEADAKAEGTKPHLELNTTGFRTLIDDYKDIWDSINGKKHPWESNPWVWVIEFAVWDDKSVVIPEGAESV